MNNKTFLLYTNFCIFLHMIIFSNTFILIPGFNYCSYLANLPPSSQSSPLPRQPSPPHKAPPLLTKIPPYLANLPPILKGYSLTSEEGNAPMWKGEQLHLGVRETRPLTLVFTPTTVAKEQCTELTFNCKQVCEMD